METQSGLPKLFFGALIVAAAASATALIGLGVVRHRGTGDQRSRPTVPVSNSAIPPIDANQTTRFETATFALG
jgi:hypothetical protein